ncbi:GmrSD restriction endonuclease domain-containing protein [Rubrolithibacter danxiaensis]|uniref:GmrSD restriction endonuclease domain-containing protein n=1 Tax=Rubrolithibacter danxiaensis TaxID=3390805 RepID=UPI003BF83BBB
MITIDNAFNTENRSVFEYYQRPGVGFYIPLYQREYSWDFDNIGQLLEDIAKGIENVIEDDDSDENEIRFLGTIITVTEADKNKVQPQDTRALPSSIEKVIDGQQRLSTISLLSALLFKHIDISKERLLKSLKKFSEEDREELINNINEITQFWKDKLKDVFAVDLKRGTPTLKPKIIRGSVDKWIMSETQNESYRSTVSRYLFEFIDHFLRGKEYPKFDKESNAGKNLTIASNWLNRVVFEAHITDNGFCSGLEIINNINQENIWQYDRSHLISLINSEEFEDKNSFSYQLTAMIQILAVCHYLLDRCCFTIIQPVNDDWAFDMFQSLNATGTPLTAIETFKPLVVNTANLDGGEFKNSIENKYFNKIERAFEDMKSAAQKSKLTNELLTSFALPIEGHKLATHFSSQRKWLEKIYQKRLAGSDAKRDFIKFFGNYSEFYDEIWNNYRADGDMPIRSLIGTSDADLVSLLILFLKESNHKMSITMLASFYSNMVEGKEESVANFSNAVKAISAFYILWRSAYGNGGLDDAYRTFFKGSKQGLEPHQWIESRDFNLSELKTYLQQVLAGREITDRNSWLAKALPFCRYDNSTTIVKFALYNAAHDTIPNTDQKGVMKAATPHSAPFLRLSQWKNPDFQTIEHIAPERSEGDWSTSLYGLDKLYHSVGNLTLLPNGVNISASNRGWKEKVLYYKHLSEQDIDKLVELANKAKAAGIELAENTVKMLQGSNYSSHIAHILTYEDAEWNAEIVQKRAKKILELLWDRIAPWIF